MWKAHVKAATLLLSWMAFSKNKQIRDASSGDKNNPEVYYSTIRISRWRGVSRGDTTRCELQQERKQRETEGTLQHDDRHVEHKDPESRWEAREFEKEDEEECVPVLGVSEVQWKAQGEISSGEYSV